MAKARTHQGTRRAQAEHKEGESTTAEGYMNQDEVGKASSLRLTSAQLADLVFSGCARPLRAYSPSLPHLTSTPTLISRSPQIEADNHGNGKNIPLFV